MLERVLFRPSLATLIEALRDVHQELGLPTEESLWTQRIGELRSRPEGSQLWTPIPQDDDTQGDVTLTWWTDAENQRWFLIERDAADDSRPPAARLYAQGAFLCGDASGPTWVFLCRCGATVRPTAGEPWMGRRCLECHQKRQQRESTPRAILFPTWCPALCSLVWPDGTRLVVVADGPDRYRALVRDERDQTLESIDWITRPWKKAQVASDGSRLLVLTNDGRLIESPGLDGDRRLVLDETVENFWLSPQGDSVAVKLAMGTTQVCVLEADQWVHRASFLQRSTQLVSWRFDGRALLINLATGLRYLRLGNPGHSLTLEEQRGEDLQLGADMRGQFTEGDLLLGILRGNARLYRRGSSFDSYRPFSQWRRPTSLRGYFDRMVLSPDRRFMATFAKNPKSPLWVVDLRTMETVLEVLDWPGRSATPHHLAFTHDGGSLIVDHHQVIPWRALAGPIAPAEIPATEPPAQTEVARARSSESPRSRPEAVPFREVGLTVERFLRNPTRDEVTQTLAEMSHRVCQSPPEGFTVEQLCSRMALAVEGGLVQKPWSGRWVRPQSDELWLCLRYDPALTPTRALPPIVVDFYRQGAFRVGQSVETMQDVMLCRCGATLRAEEAGWRYRSCAVCEIRRQQGERAPRTVSFPTWCPAVTPRGGVAFLPQGERVVAFAHGSDEVVLERRDARDRCLADLGTFPAGGRLSASADGCWVAYHRRGGGVHLYSCAHRYWTTVDFRVDSLVFAPTADSLAVRLVRDRWRFLRHVGGRWWSVGDGGDLPVLGWSANAREVITTNGTQYTRWRWNPLNVTEGGHYVPLSEEQPRGASVNRPREVRLLGGPHPECWHLLSRRGITRQSFAGNRPERLAFRPVELGSLRRLSLALSANQRWLAYARYGVVVVEDLWTLHRVAIIEPRQEEQIHDLAFAADDQWLVLNGQEVVPWQRLLSVRSGI